MNSFLIKVAGCIVEVESCSDYPFKMCKDILTTGNPDFKVNISKEDIMHEKSKYGPLVKDTIKFDNTCEFVVLLRKIAESVIDYGAFLMHGAVISLDGKSFLFSGKSGIGKTTHICKWLLNKPDTVIVNGDKPFILTGNRTMACGTPWSGKERFYTNTTVPLNAILFMERNDDNIITKLSFSEALPMLIKYIYIPESSDKLCKSLKLLRSLEHNVDFYRFQVNNMKDDCFDVAYNALW